MNLIVMFIGLVLTSVWSLQMKGFGYNEYGQLGNGFSPTKTIPTRLNILSVKNICAGQHSLILTNDGTAFAFGNNQHGQLGDGTTTSRSLPTIVQGENSDIIAVAAGNSHSLMLKNNGSVFAFGSNLYGQLGDGTNSNKNTPTIVQGENSNVIAIAAGHYHSIILKNDGYVFVFGSNGFGQLGDGTKANRNTPTIVQGENSNIIAIAGGFHHSLILKNNGTVFSFGYNGFGQLGDGTTEDRNTTTIVQGEISNITAISAGAFHSFVLMNNGSGFSFGSNQYGQLGDGTTADRYTPTTVQGENSNIIAISANYYHALMLKNNGTVFAFGSNQYGQLGDGTTTSRSLPTIVQGENSDIIAISAGISRSLILKNNGSVFAFGNDAQGDLGLGKTNVETKPIPPLIENVNIAFASQSDTSSYFVKQNGSAFAFGLNDYGQLGDGTTTSRYLPTIVQGENSNVIAISAGSRFCLLLKNNGSVFSFGYNNYGQLGDGTTTPRSLPTIVQGENSDIIAISAGFQHSLMLKNNGSVFAFGANFYGQLGDGTITKRYTPTIVQGENSNVIAIAAGTYHHSLILKNNGSVFAFGWNDNGQLGDGTRANRYLPTIVQGENSNIIAIAAGNYHSLMLKNNGSVFSFGYNAHGQLGDGTTTLIPRTSPAIVQGENSNVIAISAGKYHSLMLKNNGTALGFGWNALGELGDGTTTNRKLPTLIPNETYITQIGSGGHSSFILLDITICHGIDSRDPNVCSGQGKCNATDVCHCNDHHEGSNCQQRKLIYDLLVALCKNKSSCTLTDWENCMLEGSACYCNASRYSGIVICDGTDVTDIDLSGNFIKYSDPKTTLPRSLEEFIMDNITNSQPASILSFPASFTNLKKISLERNNLCGPYPWNSSVFNVNLKDHEKTLWCDELMNKDGCNQPGLLSVTNQRFIVETASPKNVRITFNGACDINYSTLKCGGTDFPEGVPNVGFSDSHIDCPTTSIIGLRSQIYLLSHSGDVISQNTSTFAIVPQIVDFLNGTPAAHINQTLYAKFKLSKGVPQEIHGELACYSHVFIGMNGTVTTIDGKDDEILCTLLGNQTAFQPTNIGIFMRNRETNRTFTQQIYDPNVGITSNYLLGYVNEPIPISTPNPINFANRILVNADVVMTVNDTSYIPEIPLIGATNAFVKFPTSNFHKSVSKNGGVYQIDGNFVTNFGQISDLNKSPYLQFIVNFNQSGSYYIFNDGESAELVGNFYIGLNESTAVQVARPITLGYFPQASQKSDAPILDIPTSGNHLIHIWGGNKTIGLSSIVLSKTDSVALNLADPSTVISTYETFRAPVTIYSPGISKIKLDYKNRISLELLPISKSIDFVTVEQGTILNSHPFGALRNQNFQLILLTNISKTEYNGIIQHYCSHGGMISAAIQIDTKFTCDLTVGGTDPFIEVMIHANHTISNESLVVTTNSARIYIYDALDAGNLHPFASNHQLTSQEVTIKTQSLPIEFSRVYCRHVSVSHGILYYKSERISNTDANCTIKIPSITQLNLEESSIGLWVNASTSLGGENSFYISRHNLTHVVVRTPITSSLSLVTFNSTEIVNFALNLTHPQNYNFSLIGKSRFGEAVFPCNGVGNCKTVILPTPEFPISNVLHMQLEDGMNSQTIESTTFYTSSNLTLITTSQVFLLDPYQMKQTIRFTATNPTFNADFKFYCLDSRTSKKIPANTTNGSTHLYCDIESRLVDEEFSISIYVNSSVPELNTIISLPAPLNYNEIRLYPLYVEKSQSRVIHILRNDSSKYIIPERYRNGSYILFDANTGVENPCQANSTDVTCVFQQVGFGIYDVYLTYFRFYKLLTVVSSNINVTRPLLTYKSTSIDISPHATLIGRNTTVSMIFNENIFNVDPRITNIEYFCGIQENGNSKHVATRINQNQINCTIPYLGLSQITLNGYIRVPSISPDYLLISTNSSTFYYIDPKILSISPTSNRFQTSYEMTSYTLTTVFPSPNLLQHVKGSFNTSETIVSPDTVVTGTFPNNGFNVTFQPSSPGRINVFLEYQEGNERFSLSSNQIELVFATKSVITSFSPSVAITNITNHVVIASEFLEKDYGTVQFITKYGFPGNVYHNQTVETNSTIVGTKRHFSTTFFIKDPTSYQLSVWMLAYGRELEILSPVSYKFIDSNFFTPNHGLTAGGDIVKILSPKSTNKMVTIGNPFNIDHIFNCSKISEQLICTTPPFNSTFNAFNSYTLYFHENGDTLSAKFVLYEQRNIISIHPSVIPISNSFPTFSLNATFDKVTNLVEGSFIGIMTGSTTKNVDFGLVNGVYAYNPNITSNGLVAGDYSVKFNYKNPFSLEFKEQFTCTDSKNVTFVDVTSTITISSVRCDDITYINEIMTVEIDRAVNLPSKISPFVKCKLENEFVPTIRISDKTFKCNVSSPIPGVKYITLWYANNDALAGEMLVSPNSLPIVFVDKISIQSIDPFTTLMSINTQTKLFTDFQLDVFGGNVTYQVVLSDLSAVVPTLENGIFEGSYMQFGNPRIENITLHIQSKVCVNKLVFSRNSIPYIFRRPVEIESSSPFAMGYSSNSQNFTFDISLKLKTGDSVLNDVGLICKYNSTGDGFKRSKARIEGNFIKCEITKSIFSSPIEYLNVGLALNTSSFSNDSTYFSNLVKVVFHKEPLKYQSLTIFDDSLSDDFLIDLPKYENDFIYQLNMTEELSSERYTLFNCVKGVGLSCKPSLNSLKPLHQPSNYNVTLVITKSNAPGVFTIININSIVFFNRNNPLISAIPFFASYLAHKYNPLKVYLTLDGTLNNQKFKFYCMNSTNGDVLSVATIQNPGTANSSITCDVKSSNVENLQLTIGIEYNSSYYEISTKATIQFINQILIDQNTCGFQSGKTEFELLHPDSFPTIFKQDYNITVKYADHDGYKHAICVVKTSKLKLCHSATIDSNINAKYIQYSIFINDIHAISLSPWFVYFAVPSIDKIIPSMVDIFTSGKTIQLSSSSFSSSNNQNTIYRIRYEELNENQICKIESSTIISCPVSSHTNLVATEITLKLSIDGNNYETLDKKLYLYTNDINSDKAITLTANSLSPNIVSISKMTNVSFTINIPAGVNLPTSSIFVRFNDEVINEIAIGSIQNGKVSCEIPSLGKYNIFYPRTISVDVSLDGVSFFGSSQILKLNGFYIVDVSPKVFIVDRPLKIYMKNFPQTVGKSLTMRASSIIQNKHIPFNCDTNFTICISAANPSDTGDYILNFVDDTQTKYYIPLVTENVGILAAPTVTIPTVKILRVMVNKGYINGNGFEAFKESIKIRGKFDGNIYEATSIDVTSTKIGFIFGTIKRSLKYKRSFGNSLQISYNLGVNYTIISDKIELVDPFSLDNVIVQSVDSSAQDITYSFQNTTLKLLGKNLNGSAIIKLQNDFFSYTTTSKSTDSGFILVIIPEFRYYTPPHLSFTFPIQATIGISMNDGIDFKTRSISISDKFANFFLVGIEPSIGERRNFNITMRGANLELVEECEFRDSNATLLYRNDKFLVGSDVVCTFVYQPQFDSFNEILINLRNRFNDTSDSLKYNLIQNPSPQTIVPSSGEAVGNYSVIITGTFDQRFNEIFIKIGTVRIAEPCILLNTSAVQCPVVSNADGSIKFELSYNRIDWYATASNFTYLPCKPGYGTSSYQEPCLPCPLGQYKSNNGIEVCTNCPVNTFSDKLASSNCTNCPDKMKSPKSTNGLKSASECVCINNTMAHPKTGICIDCPIGGICTPENVTFPRSQKGWWFSKIDITLFYQCYPVERCIPDTPDNCTIGYEGLRCGKCSDGYYKSKLVCKKCNDAYLTASSLVLAIILMFLIMIVAAFFVVITSTKISHMTSISITFGYWQIISTFSAIDLNWPTAVGGTLSAASASNFNFDFLAPECIFRIFGLTYNYYYIYFTQISMPFVFLFAFIIIYIIAVLRSLFATTIGNRIANLLKLKYKRPWKSDPENDDQMEKKKKNKIIQVMKSVCRSIGNGFIWVRNFALWSVRQKSTIVDLKRLLNKIVGAYLSFISFFFLRIMTTSFQIFGCDYQPNGIYTFKESPDITCFEGIWFIFLPLSVISIILFGIGSVLYFTVLILNYKKLEKSETFISINRFTLSKYKKKFFYWDLFDSIRKASFSVLTTFFKPMFLITTGIGIIFTGMILQVNFIPYRKKFHNLMDYFILMSTLMTLFAGLLLFVVDANGGTKVVLDPGLRDFLSFVMPGVTIALIIGSNLVVVGMYLFDVYIRRKKAKERQKRKQQIVDGQITKNVSDGRNLEVSDNAFPSDVEHDFQFTIKFEEASDAEDDLKSMNEIMEDVFSIRRVKKKIFLISRAGKRTVMKIAKKTNVEIDDNITSRSQLVSDSSMTNVMPNGFTIKSEYLGNVTYVGSKSERQRATTTELLK